MRSTLMSSSPLYRTFALLFLAGWTWAAPAHATSEEEDDYALRWANGLKSEDLRFNALSANPKANPRMVQVPLRSDVYERTAGEEDLKRQLEDPSARAFMHYVVSCALGPGQSLQWVDRTGNTHRWNGRIGLCPEWSNGPASLECRRWVSACVLSRNNAYGRRVVVSARGEKPLAPDFFTPRIAVPGDPFHRYTRRRVESLQACASPRSGVSRDCGFQREYVGLCTPGASVHVGAGGKPPAKGCGDTVAPLGATASGTMVLRVCQGLAACNTAAALAESEGTCGTSLPAVSFDCPTSGSFNVMSAPLDSGGTGDVEVAALEAQYVSPEEDVFAIREGAFYGTIFGPGALAPGVNVHVDVEDTVHKDPNLQVKGAIYPKMFSCRAPTWTNELAYATSRLCTMPDVNCVAYPVGRCNATVSVDTYTGPRCQVDSATGHGEYGRCVGQAGELYLEVVTPHLNQPCDVVDGTACETSG